MFYQYSKVFWKWLQITALRIISILFGTLAPNNNPVHLNFYHVGYNKLVRLPFFFWLPFNFARVFWLELWAIGQIFVRNEWKLRIWQLSKKGMFFLGHPVFEKYDWFRDYSTCHPIYLMGMVINFFSTETKIIWESNFISLVTIKFQTLFLKSF